MPPSKQPEETTFDRAPPRKLGIGAAKAASTKAMKRGKRPVTLATVKFTEPKPDPSG